MVCGFFLSVLHIKYLLLMFVVHCGGKEQRDTSDTSLRVSRNNITRWGVLVIEGRIKSSTGGAEDDVLNIDVTRAVNYISRKGVRKWQKLRI